MYAFHLDLFRQMKRTGAPYKEPDNHPQRTVTAMRLLAAIPDNSLRASVSHSLYRVRLTYCITTCVYRDTHPHQSTHAHTHIRPTGTRIVMSLISKFWRT